MSQTFLLILSFFVLSTQFLLSIDLIEPYNDYKIGKSYNPKQIDSLVIDIDGILSEKIWKNVDPIEDFLQVSPDFLSTPSENTKVKILYDSEYIYIGVVLDMTSGKVISQFGEYDDFLGAFENKSDYFVVEIDSRHDHLTSYAFAVNASGVQSDYMIYNNQEIEDYWDGNWGSAVRVNDNRWTVEFAIPFSLLRYSKNEIQNWGVNFIRYIKYKNEIM